MSAQRWFWRTLGLACSIVLLYAAATYSLDVFGTFRDTHGRSLPAYGLYDSHSDDRTSKYLLSQRYVPENFNGLILGSSNVANFPVDHAGGLRFYNEAVSAGNASEMRILCAQALKHGHYRVALVELFPSMTISHGIKEGLEESRPSDAFGSINSVSSEAYAVMVKLHLMKTPFFPDGAKDMMVRLKPTERILSPLNEVDPQSVSDYIGMVQDLQAHGVEIVYIVPPVYRPAYLRYRSEIDGYVKSMQKQIPPGTLLDMNTDEYAWFSGNPDNFADSLHLNLAGAGRMGQLLDGLIPHILQESPTTNAPAR